MSDLTQNLPNGPSFEERVFARFDAIDARLQALENQGERFAARLGALEDQGRQFEARLHALETQAEERALDTKPIWQRALAELVEVKGELVEVKVELREVKQNLATVGRKLEVLGRDIVEVRAKQLDIEERVEKLEPKPMQ